MFIDKTDVLGRGLAKYPSIFIEGAAAIGKTTAVNMFLKAHPEATSDVFNMNKEADSETFFHRFQQLGLELVDKEPSGERFLVFDNIEKDVTSDFMNGIADIIEKMPADGNLKVIFISRHKPPLQLLELLWKGKMGMIYPSSLMFTQADVTKYVRAWSSSLPPMEVYNHTGGWPGCVSALVSIAEQVSGDDNARVGKTISMLFDRYEIKGYIQNVILDGLSENERKVLSLASSCPWVNEESCQIIWGLSYMKETLVDLERNGLLQYNDMKGYWKASPVITSAARTASIVDDADADLDRKLGKWYESQNAIHEALSIFKKSGLKDEYIRCMISNYDVVGFDELTASDVVEWKPFATEKISSVESSIRLCYLRGMYMYLNQDFAGFEREIDRAKSIEKKLSGHPEEKSAAEIYLNLTFADPKMDIEGWLELLSERGRWAPIRLYCLTENSSDVLTGYRELSALFACSAREEKRRMTLLKAVLGKKEWVALQLARLSYSFEIDKKNILESEDWAVVLKVAGGDDKYSWRLRMSCLYLLNKVYLANNDPEVLTQMKALQMTLSQESNPLCRSYLQAIHNIYALRGSGDSLATRWLKETSTDSSLQVNEHNYQMVLLMVKGLLAINQPEIAGRVLRKLIPYIQKYRRSRIMAEILFQQAIVDWAEGKNGSAVRNAVESFMYNGDSRYVTFYASYGQRGYEVLEAYVEWLRNVEPEKWRGKKRYNYGNVLSMPREEYLSMIIRQAKRASKGQSDDMVEKLTLMETIVLQCLNKGMSNMEICEDLNLKLPTVKTHISNLYKKMGVNSRVQAIVRGKEIGILR